MKKKYAKILKISYKIFAAIFTIVAVVFCIFYSDSGRQILLNAATKILEHKGIHCEINGVTRDLSKIDKITLKTSKNSTLFIEGISVKKASSRFDICADKVTFRSTKSNLNVKNSRQKSPENSLLNSGIKLPFSSFKMVRTFLDKLRIKECLIDLPNGQHAIKNFSYLHIRSTDKMECNLCDFGSESFVNLQLNWGVFRSKKIEVSFQKIAGLNGTVTILNPEKDMSDYKLNLKCNLEPKPDKDADNKSSTNTNNKYKILAIDSWGKLQRLSRTIQAKKVLLTYNDYIYETSGNAVINSDCIDLKMQIICDDFITKYATNVPQEFWKNFENVQIYISSKYRFKNVLDQELVADFRKDKKSIGKLYGKIFDNQINISGDVNWIDIYGYNLKNLECKITNFRSIFASITGQDFSLRSSAKIGNGVSIDSAIFEVQGNGFLQLSKPFQISSNYTEQKNSSLNFSDLSASFQFKDIDFFQRIVSIFADPKWTISGDCKGTFFRNKSQKFSISCSGDKLKFLDYKISNYSFESNEDQGDRKLVGHAKNTSAFGQNFHDISLDVAKNRLSVSLKNSDNIIVNASGEVSDFYEKISLDSCKISVSTDSGKVHCNVKNFFMDLPKNECNFVCEISNNKNQTPGILKLNSNKTSTKIEVIDFRTGMLKGIFKTPIPKWCLNGGVNLSHPNSLLNEVSGDGQIIISEFFCRHNELKLYTKFGDNIQINGVINSLSGDKIQCDVSIPTTIEKIWQAIKENRRTIPLLCTISGSTHLEHLFELADGNDIRGLLKCDLKISGNFASPKINGNAILQDAHFVIGDIFLRRGNIGCVCSADNIKISHAEFTDNRNKKLTASGSGKFFFEGFVPNIKTDLTLSGDNYDLFDSKDLKIRIKGKGKITGPIDNLLISGKVEATKCVIQNVDTEMEDSKAGIVISNEKNVFIKNKDKETKQKDFCRYDIALICPKIEVIGDIYNLYFNGNLQLITYDDVASLVGSLVLKKGSLDLFGKKMIVRKGKAEFFEQYPFDPRLSVLFYNNFGDMIVYLKVKNVPQKGGSFNIYSVPSSSPEIILSNMLFGKDLKNLSVSEAAQFAQAMASFNKSGGLFSIMNGLKKIGIVDTISFSTTDDDEATKSLNTNSQTSNDSTNLNVTAGKYIGDKVFISINKKSDNPTSFDIDYAITPKISIKANTNGEAGINWRYKY